MSQTKASDTPLIRNRYPVQCPTHGSNNFAYLVCLCVAKSMERVKTVDKPTRTSMGFIKCGRAEPHRVEEYVPICESCAREQGITHVGALLQ